MLTSLCAWISNNPHDWNIYTYALTYACNTQPQLSTSRAPVKLVLTKPPGTIAASLPSTKYNWPVDFKNKEKWHAKVILEAQERLQNAEERYKKNFDNSLPKNSENINPGDEVFLSVERMV